MYFGFHLLVLRITPQSSYRVYSSKLVVSLKRYNEIPSSGQKEVKPKICVLLLIYLVVCYVCLSLSISHLSHHLGQMISARSNLEGIQNDSTWLIPTYCSGSGSCWSLLRDFTLWLPWVGPMGLKLGDESLQNLDEMQESRFLPLGQLNREDYSAKRRGKYPGEAAKRGQGGQGLRGSQHPRCRTPSSKFMMCPIHEINKISQLKYKRLHSGWISTTSLKSPK